MSDLAIPADLGEGAATPADARSWAMILVCVALAALWFAAAFALVQGGRNVAVYRGTGTSELDVEIGVEVGLGTSGGGEVVLSATPSGEAATVAHIGPYSLLMNANDAIKSWCAVNNREIAGPSWEVYGHWTDDAEKLRTDVFYLLKTAG